MFKGSHKIRPFEYPLHKFLTEKCGPKSTDWGKKNAVECGLHKSLVYRHMKKVFTDAIITHLLSQMRTVHSPAGRKYEKLPTGMKVHVAKTVEHGVFDQFDEDQGPALYFHHPFFTIV